MEWPWLPQVHLSTGPARTKPTQAGTASKGTKNETSNRISHAEESKIADGHEPGRDDGSAGAAPGRRGWSIESGRNCACIHAESGTCGRSHRSTCPRQGRV